MSRSEERPPAAENDREGGAEESPLERRRFLSRLGSGLVTAALASPAILAVRSCVPNALYEKPRRFKAGDPESFSAGPNFLSEHRIFVFRRGETFHCQSAVCTHLGCTVQLVRTASVKTDEDFEFHCPCHGSKFDAQGSPYAGPAPRPLPYFRLEIAPDDGQLVVDLSQPADQGWRLTLPT